jgi:hypothetical protein
MPIPREASKMVVLHRSFHQEFGGHGEVALSNVFSLLSNHLVGKGPSQVVSRDNYYAGSVFRSRPFKYVAQLKTETRAVGFWSCRTSQRLGHRAAHRRPSSRQAWQQSLVASRKTRCAIRMLTSLAWQYRARLLSSCQSQNFSVHDPRSQ